MDVHRMSKVNNFDLTGTAVCQGCAAIVDRKELINNDDLCNSCQYEQDAKNDAKDEE